ncbi:MAG: hypothetical protein ACRDRS_07540 [Pseudonocardiaceae bacterium]
MADLTVDGAGLQNLVSMLRAFADDMHEATSSLGSAQANGLGHRELESASDHFAGEWAYGIGQLRDASSTVAKQLDDGIRCYGECDGGHEKRRYHESYTKPSSDKINDLEISSSADWAKITSGSFA